MIKHRIVCKRIVREKSWANKKYSVHHGKPWADYTYCTITLCFIKKERFKNNLKVEWVSVSWTQTESWFHSGRAWKLKVLWNMIRANYTKKKKKERKRRKSVLISANENMPLFFIPLHSSLPFCFYSLGKQWSVFPLISKWMVSSALPSASIDLNSSTAICLLSQLTMIMTIELSSSTQK